MPRRVLYGWLVESSGRYCVSKIPPDLPQLPFHLFATIGAAEAEATRRKAIVVWSGPALAEKNRQEAAA